MTGQSFTLFTYSHLLKQILHIILSLQVFRESCGSIREKQICTHSFQNIYVFVPAPDGSHSAPDAKCALLFRKTHSFHSAPIAKCTHSSQNIYVFCSGSRRLPSRLPPKSKEASSKTPTFADRPDSYLYH